MITVSIVIVCMNNLKNLYPCLDSIKKHTQVSYETFVVAYLFSKENLEKVKKDYPWVIFIESNEIRGFSENNNLALRQAKGKYCFVVNDDTEMKMACIDKLVTSIESLPKEVAVLSPVLLNANGTIQVCGRPPVTTNRFILQLFRLWNENMDKLFSNKEGLFKTYNLIGAAFLIKTDIFKKMGWFDEQYFFCPEDIALSTNLNKKGYECWVDAESLIYHYEGMSSKSKSLIQTATRPSARRGSILFHSNNSSSFTFILKLLSFIGTLYILGVHFLKSIYHKDSAAYKIMTKGDLNILTTAFSNKSPKEIFIKYYSRL